MLGEIAVAAFRIATGLHGLASLVISETKHAGPLAADSSHASQELPHFRLREEKYLRCPPRPKLSTLSQVYCGIERNQAEEICLWRAFKIVEPSSVAKRSLGPSRGFRLRVRPR